MRHSAKPLCNATLTPGYAPELAQQIKRTVRGMAHFAGTGPSGATCGTCQHLGYFRQRINAQGVVVHTERCGGCAAFNRLTGKHGDAPPPRTPGCKYYEKAEG
jgi:hypothetical protein